MRFTSIALYALTAATVVDAKGKAELPQQFKPRAQDNPGSLVFGGGNAAPREFPYFVNLPGCGGALIAPDTVLTAVHCGNYQGDEILVGAYSFADNDMFHAGAVLRTCAKWIGHPGYDPYNGQVNDFAICVLDEPVVINQDEVVLTINAESEDDFPINGEELVAMGFGEMGGSGFFTEYPETLQKTTLEGRRCGNGISEQVCAGGPDGQDGVTGVCQYDDGVPLIKVVPQDDGPDLHVHVGLMSSRNNCPATTTTIYARTSAGAEWVNEAQCLLGSAYGVDCPPPPEPVVCEEGQSRLVINVTTDDYSTENRYELEKQTARRSFELIAENKLFFNNFQHSETFCLDAGETYRWRLYDLAKDGLCYLGVCGSYSLEVDGIVVAEGDEFSGREVRVAVTGGECNDSTIEFQTSTPYGGGANVVCSDAGPYLSSFPSSAGTVCEAPVSTGGVFSDYCVSTCSTYGHGNILRCGGTLLLG